MCGKSKINNSASEDNGDVRIYFFFISTRILNKKEIVRAQLPLSVYIIPQKNFTICELPGTFVLDVDTWRFKMLA